MTLKIFDFTYHEWKNTFKKSFSFWTYFMLSETAVSKFLIPFYKKDLKHFIYKYTTFFCSSEE